MEGSAVKREAMDALIRRVAALEGREWPDSQAETWQHVWEVTGVDNGTCTVRCRYDNDNLIETAELTGVVYDADNAPAVGDIGLLVRLGSGALFFFSKPRKVLVYTPKYARCLQEHGSASYVLYEQEYSSGSWSTIKDTLGVWKFEVPILLCEGERGLVTFEDEYWSQIMFDRSTGEGTARDIRAAGKFCVLLEDFNINTITRAGLEALTSADSQYLWWASSGATPTTDLDAWWKGLGVGDPSANYNVWHAYSETYDKVYGAALFSNDGWNTYVGTPDETAIRRLMLAGDPLEAVVRASVLAGSDTER